MYPILKILVLATVVAGAMPVRAAAVPTAAPAASASAQALHLVDGFRSAHWDMDEAGVRSAIEHDFPAVTDAVRLIKDAAGTHALALHLDRLEPGPGGAEITYVFDVRTQRLVHVNVVWSTGPAPEATERGRMARAAAQLTSYFHRQSWEPGATAQRLAPDASFAIVFAGVDSQAEAVEVRLSGVVFERPGQPPSSPSGPAVLRVAYFASIANDASPLAQEAATQTRASVQ